MKLNKLITSICNLPIIASTIAPLTSCHQEKTTFVGGSLELFGYQHVAGYDQNTWLLKIGNEIIDASYSFIWKSVPLSPANIQYVGGRIIWMAGINPGTYEFQIRALTSAQIVMSPLIKLTIKASDQVAYFNPLNNEDHYYFNYGEVHSIGEWHLLCGEKTVPTAEYSLEPIDCPDEIEEGKIYINSENKNIDTSPELAEGIYNFILHANDGRHGMISQKLCIIIYVQAEDNDFTWDDTDLGHPVMTEYQGPNKVIRLPEKHDYAGTLYDVLTFGDEAFKETNLSCVIFPDCERIGNSCFENSSLRYALFEKNMGSLGNKSFYNCAQLERVDWEGRPYAAYEWKEVGEECFKDCINLSSIPEIEVETISKSAFEKCQNLTHIICFSEEIKENAFDSCTNLAQIQFDDNLLSISKNAYRNCVSLNAIAFRGELDSWKYIDKDENWISPIDEKAILVSSSTVVDPVYMHIEWTYLWKVA